MRKKNVIKRAEEIKSILNSMMTLTFYNCKSRDPEIASDYSQINSLAHDCLVKVDRLVSEHKREKDELV
jgi:hypothetical protein